jgi:UDP-N-acetylglucosamine enolpyruvyl transferase
VAGARHIDRGYAGMDEALRALGADVTRTRIADPAYA